ncbi:MAG TPA: hypothetical protein VGF69_16820 [Thermoanaerobaculia bacterium]|jgi:hypothetical protein
MLDSLRKPFLFLCAILIVLAVLVELGSGWLVRPPALQRGLPPDIASQLSPAQLLMAQRQLASIPSAGQSEEPPGYGITALAKVDIMLLLTIGLMALSLVIGDHLQGRTQGIIGLIVGVLVFIAAFKELFAAFIELMIRVTLLLAVPFGTIAYMALYASFDRSGAAMILGLSWFLKIAAVVCLILAQQKYLKQTGLMLLVATSLIASFVVSFLHGLPPGFLVNITDPIAAIVCDILALIWAVVAVLYGIVAVIKALQPA